MRHNVTNHPAKRALKKIDIPLKLLFIFFALFVCDINNSYSQKTSPEGFGNVEKVLKDGVNKYATDAGATETSISTMQSYTAAYSYYYVKSGHADVYNIVVSLPAVKNYGFYYMVNGEKRNSYAIKNNAPYTIKGIEIEIYQPKTGYKKTLNFSVDGIWGKGKTSAYTAIAFTGIDLQNAKPNSMVANGKIMPPSSSLETVMKSFKVRVINNGKLSASSYPSEIVKRIIKEAREKKPEPARQEYAIMLSSSSGSSSSSSKKPASSSNTNKPSSSNNSSSASGSRSNGMDDYFNKMEVQKIVNSYKKKEKQEESIFDNKETRAAEAAERRKKEQEETEEKEQTKLREELYDKRKGMLNKFPVWKEFSAGQQTGNDKIFFFCYAYDYGNLKIKNMPILVSDVFEVHRKPDGTWPSKGLLNSEIGVIMEDYADGFAVSDNKNNNHRTDVIVGSYTSATEAQIALSAFKSSMQSTGAKFKVVENLEENISTDHNTFYIAKSAQVHYEKHQYSQSLKLFKIAATQYGNKAEYYVGMAQSAYKINPFAETGNIGINREVINYIKKALEIEPQNASTHYSVALIYADFTYNGRLSYTPEAITHMKKAAELGNSRALKWIDENDATVNGRFVFKNPTNNKYGVNDAMKNLIVPAVYDRIFEISNGKFTVIQNDRYGWIDKNGVTIIPVKYREIQDVGEGLYAAKSDDSYNIDFFDSTGKKVFSADYSEVGRFSDGLLSVGVIFKTKSEYASGLGHENTMWGFIDKTGDMVIDPVYEKVYAFSEGAAPVSLDNEKWGLIDRSGKELLPFNYDDLGHLKEGLIPVQIGRKWGYMNILGDVIIKPRYEKAWEFSDGKARVSTGKKAFYVDKTGEKINFN